MIVQIGDFVKVIDQDITGQVIEMYSNKAVIIDDHSEYEYPDSRLEYHLSELESVA